MEQKTIISLVVAALLLVGLGWFASAQFGKAPTVAGYDPTTVNNPWTFLAAVTHSAAVTFSSTLSVAGETSVKGLTQGGGVVTIAQTSAAVTLTEANLLAGDVITFTASTTQGALTATLPATSTMTTLLPNAGDYRTWVIENPFTAAATTTTIAAGAGIDLQEPDGQNVVIGIDNYAWLTCFREASTDVVCRVDETIPAD